MYFNSYKSTTNSALLLKGVQAIHRLNIHDRTAVVFLGRNCIIISTVWGLHRSPVTERYKSKERLIVPLG
jgi:hypothetical protein